ncbi:zinc-binding dehydrogenase (plasmid) [Curtobacterium sp. YC1]|uniref:quinone oxidoreductase family protein n=1 Tax=Curtobacterium sp. YC1 TaxID=2795488 RepID=UPI0018E5049C|nr:zinc-binding dehydrogenase [Curtobacterium sp. YC1]QQD77909.1 zinc-binding dehydrogenase [Curtobacterium sp. YC1]
MRSWRAAAFGIPSDVLGLLDTDVPVPGPGEALLRVLAANIGLPDRMMLEGRYFMVPEPPVTPGQEVVGIVEVAGEGYPYPVGARVIGITNFATGSGGLAEYCLSPAPGAVFAPEGMGDVEAAAFLGTFHVAHVGLVDRARAAAGETVLVLGGSGGTGSTAIQLAKALGLRVIATVRDPAKTDFCLAQGADHVINTQAEPLAKRVRALTGGKGADIAYDTVGTPLRQQALESIATGGRFVLVGFAGGTSFSPIDPLELLGRGISVSGASHIGRTVAERDAAIATLGMLSDQGRIHMPIDQVVDFADVPGALDRLGGSVSGKLIAHIADA